MSFLFDTDLIFILLNPIQTDININQVLLTQLLFHHQLVQTWSVDLRHTLLQGLEALSVLSSYVKVQQVLATYIPAISGGDSSKR